MSYLSIKNVAIRGLSACVPRATEENNDSALFSDREESEKFIKSTGVERRRVSDSKTTTSDLCYAAAEKLIVDLNWSKESIDCLVFVSQTPDYILPATSCVLQDRLGLSKDCYTLDISLGCSGWVYGLSVVSSLLSSGGFRKALLLAGETPTKIVSPNDKSCWPLFGDAGTATALEYLEDSDPLNFHFSSDGNGYEAIIIPDGGFRTPFSADSLFSEYDSEGIGRNKLHLVLNGIDVFTFGITKAPQSVNFLCEKFDIDRNNIDYFLFHQANMFMNEKIRKKLKTEEAKVPYSMKNFGNTSSASIPLTMVTKLNHELMTKKLSLLACGFGVGLHWGSVAFVTDQIIVSPLIEI